MICINKQAILIKIQIFSSLTILILDTILINFGYGLIGIAIGTIIGYAIYGISYSFTALYFISKNKTQIFYALSKQLLPVILLAISFFILKNTIEFGNEIKTQIINASIKLFFLIIILFSILWGTNLDGKLITMIKKYI